MEELGILFQNGGIRNFVVVGLRNLSKVLLFANFSGIEIFFSKMLGLGILWWRDHEFCTLLKFSICPTNWSGSISLKNDHL